MVSMQPYALMIRGENVMTTQIRGWFPGGLENRVNFPLNKVFNTTTARAMVKEILNFKNIINISSRLKTIVLMSRNTIIKPHSRVALQSMKNIVNFLVQWQLQVKSNWSYRSNHTVMFVSRWYPNSNSKCVCTVPPRC